MGRGGVGWDLCVYVCLFMRTDVGWHTRMNVCIQWVLRPEYLEASHAAGRFLDEAGFEWGSSGTGSSSGSGNDDDGKVMYRNVQRTHD